MESIFRVDTFSDFKSDLLSLALQTKIDFDRENNVIVTSFRALFGNIEILK